MDSAQGVGELWRFNILISGKRWYGVWCDIYLVQLFCQQVAVVGKLSWEAKMVKM